MRKFTRRFYTVAFSSKGRLYTFKRHARGHHYVLRDGRHIGNIVMNENPKYDKWSVETIGGQVLSSAKTLEGAKREIKNLVNDLEITSENE